MSLPISDDAVPGEPGISLAPLAGVLENIEYGIVLLASNSDPCFTNSAAERILVGDAERGVLVREMRTVSRAALTHRSGRPAEVEVSTRDGHFRVRATFLLQRIRELRAGAVLVTIRPAANDLPTQASLMRRFGMTSREADVALLLAQGRRNTAIAEALKISPHTARHHTESVLTKLDVHTRSEVSRAIVNGFAPIGRP
jgi:DNA-binding CsgD family transcriptional regulator